jgi:hypothetical protein
MMQAILPDTDAYMNKITREAMRAMCSRVKAGVSLLDTLLILHRPDHLPLVHRHLISEHVFYTVSFVWQRKGEYEHTESINT